MSVPTCSRERDVWEAISHGRWPSLAEDDLRAHVDACAVCRDVVVVAAPLVADRAVASAEADPPSSAIVWWRAQARARQEAARAASQPITIVHALAIACGAGLLAAGATVWLRGWSGSIGTFMAAVNAIIVAVSTLDTRWTMLLIAVAAWMLLAPIAAYLALRED